MPGAKPLSRPLPPLILATALLSVLAAMGLLVAGFVFARPIIRDGMIVQMLGSTDLDRCTAEPAVWGGRIGGLQIYAYDHTGISQNPAAPVIEPDLLERAVSRGLTAERFVDNTTTSVVPVRPVGPCAVLRVQGRTTHPTNAVFRISVLLVLTTLAGMLLTGLAALWFVVRPFRARVEALSEAAGGVGTASFQPPAESGGPLGRIVEVLRSSHTRIEQSRVALEARNQALEDHLAGIAHDLRTPLASMQLSLEAMATEAQPPAEASKRALADAFYLSALVENLHQGTRLRHNIDVTAGRVDLEDLVIRLEQRFRIVGRHAEVEVAANLPGEAVYAACTPALAERCLANVVQNAIEHHDQGGHVAILLSATEDEFQLTIADDGPGLPDAIRASLDAESFLTDEARARGPGLGMLITSEIARRAGWSVVYEQAVPHGLIVRVTGARTPAP